MEKKTKFELEFIIRSSITILYNRIATPSGLSEWFADNCNITGDIYSFFWDNSEEQAKLLSKKSGEYIRFQWLENEGEDVYFEMRIRIDALTGEVALIITDFAVTEELEEAQMLWTSQIDKLMHILGS